MSLHLAVASLCFAQTEDGQAADGMARRPSGPATFLVNTLAEYEARDADPATGTGMEAEELRDIKVG